jgi:PAS domain S-box-containing protein
MSKTAHLPRIKILTAVLYALFIFALIVIPTLLIAERLNSDRAYREEMELRNALDKFKNRISLMIKLNANVLYSLRSYVEVNQVTLDPAKFFEYAKKFDFKNKFVGVESLYYVDVVTKGQISQFEVKLQKDKYLSNYPTYKDYKVFPVSDVETQYVIKYIYPLEHHERALGFNLMSEDVRKSALTRALETRKEVLSSPVISMATGKTGFLLLLPLYLPENSESIKGALYIFLDPETLFSDIVPESNGDRALSLKIRDVSDNASKDVIFDNSASNTSSDKTTFLPFKIPTQTFTETITLGGRTWELEVSSLITDVRIRERCIPFILLLIGVTVGFIMSGIILYLSLSRMTLVKNLSEFKSSLATQEEKFKKIAEHSLDMLYRLTISPLQKFEYVSPSAKTLTGYTAEEFYKNVKLFHDLIHPEDRKFIEITDGLLSVVPSNEPYIARGIKKDGTELWFEIMLSIVKDADPGVFSVEGSLKDITERTKNELALKERTKELEDINEMLLNRELKMIEIKEELESLRTRQK